MKRLIAGACLMVAGASLATGPVVVLKFDDWVPKGAKPGEGVNGNWRRLVTFLEQEKIPASFGIIGTCLDSPPEDFVKYTKEKMAPGGLFQLWNHGYTHAEQKAPEGTKQRITEFSAVPAEKQLESLNKTQKLAKEKLGITITSFGAPFNQVDKNTEAALAQVPEITSWFYGRNFSGKCPLAILPRSVNFENPTMKPNLESAKADFAKSKTQKVMATQGHAGAWKPEGFAMFKEFIAFLKAEGCTFMTPDQYVASLKK